MSRTNPLTLVLAVIAGGVVMWAVEAWLTSSGSATFVPSIAFGATLVLLAVVVIVLAWPVRRYTRAVVESQRAQARAEVASDAAAQAVAEDAARAASARRVNPFRAVYALALAKACSLAGSLFAGGCGAAAIWLLTRTVVGAGVAPSLFSLGAAVVLVAAGLIAESWCALPPANGERGDRVEAAAL